MLDGFSKRYAMTGFRLGYVIAPEWARRPLQIMLQNLFISANRFVQHAGIAALEQGAEAVEAMRRVYQRRRGLLVAGLRELGFGIPHEPSGAFYVLADARRFGRDSRRLAFDLLERARVGVTPGIDFGAGRRGHAALLLRGLGGHHRAGPGAPGPGAPRSRSRGAGPGRDAAASPARQPRRIE